jgi:hypothetical protein
MSLPQKEHVSRLLECFPAQHGRHDARACPRCPSWILLSFGWGLQLSFLYFPCLPRKIFASLPTFLEALLLDFLVIIRISSSISRQAHVFGW